MLPVVCAGVQSSNAIFVENLYLILFISSVFLLVHYIKYTQN